jgi:hypothetical protein
MPKFQNQFGQGDMNGVKSMIRRENFSWGLPFDGQLASMGPNY